MAPYAQGPAEAFDEHACPPSSAQILIAQQLLERLLAAGESSGKRSFMNAADLSSVSIKQLTDFLDVVKHWPLLVDLHTSIVKARDLLPSPPPPFRPSFTALLPITSVNVAPYPPSGAQQPSQLR